MSALLLLQISFSSCQERWSEAEIKIKNTNKKVKLWRAQIKQLFGRQGDDGQTAAIFIIFMTISYQAIHCAMYQRRDDRRNINNFNNNETGFFLLVEFVVKCGWVENGGKRGFLVNDEKAGEGRIMFKFSDNLLKWHWKPASLLFSWITKPYNLFLMILKPFKFSWNSENLTTSFWRC